MPNDPHEAQHVFRSDQAAQHVLERYQKLLSFWPVPHEQLHIPTRQGNTFVVASGPAGAPPIVLLHGTMSNAAAWIREVATWAREFRVYAIDIIGDAGLSAPSRPSFASDAHALWLSDVLDGLDLNKTSVVGVSMGGGIALDFAVRLPERVERLVLMCPAGVADKNIIGWALPLLLLGPWGARKVRERIVGKYPQPGTDEAKQMAELTDAIFKSMRPRTEGVSPFTDEQLTRLSMPVLVLLGEQDVTMDARRIEDRFARHVPRAQVVTYPQLRHYLGDQSPTIAEFLH